ncbi:MAG: hypothetical protein QOK07_1687 [Gemmatimonadaceae bacterium]|nr:hypothetical protein [Gemmatimonadaceae bacterium]
MRVIILLLLFASTACSAQSPQSVRVTQSEEARASLLTPAEVPLEKIGDFYYVNVAVNGHPFRFTLETGANFFAVSNRLALALGLRVDSVSSERGAIATVHIDSLTIGSAKLSEFTAAVTPLFESSPDTFDGIISIAVLKQFLATIDFPHRVLRLERGTLPEANGRDILAFAGRDPGGRVDVMLDLGSVRTPAVLDTRSFIGFVLPDSLEPRLSFVDSVRTTSRARGPSLGSFTLRRGRLNVPIRLGGFEAEKPFVTLRDRGGSVIGIPILEQFVVTLDVANKRLRFSRPDGSQRLGVPEESAAPRGANPPTGGPPLGFALAPSAPGALTIVGVVQNSNAERAGLRDGDTLVELDGVAAAQMNVSVFRATAAKGTPIRVVVEREGKRLEFVVSR